MKLNILLISIVIWNAVHGQRISSGAHDWYLRFRSERDLDRPETISYRVVSEISSSGFVATNITRTIFNPANVTQDYLLSIKLPKTASISDIKIENYEVNIHGNFSSEPEIENSRRPSSSLRIPRTGKSFEPQWNEDWIEEDLFDNYESTDADIIVKSHENNEFPHLHLYHHEHQDIDLEEGNEFNLFALPIVIGPRLNISMSVSYEDLLFADNGTWMETKMFLSPGEIVKSFCVEIFIDGQDIAETVATASVLGDITNETLVIDEVTGTLVNFTMNTLEQAHYFGSSGFYGTVSVKFSANETRYHESFSRDFALEEGYLSRESKLELTYVGSNEDDKEKKIFSYDDLILESWNMEHQH